MRGLRFSIGGIPVRLDPSFWILAGIFALSRVTVPRVGVALAVGWVVAVGFSILIHELGHAVAFRVYGHKPEVTLYAMGGVTSAATTPPLTPWRDLVVSLAGPGFGVALGLVALLIERTLLPATPRTTSELVALQFAADIVFISLVWGVVNLAPMLPLDGGRTLEAILRAVNPATARLRALYVSIVTGALLAVVAINRGLIFGLVLVGMLTMANVTELSRRRRGPEPAATPATGGLDRLGLPGGGNEAALRLAEAALLRGRVDDALEVLRQEVALRPSLATALAYAVVLQGQGRRREGQDALMPWIGDAERLLASADRERLGVDAALVLLDTLFSAGRFEAAAQAGELAYTAGAGGVAAYNTACSLARAGRPEQALRWLERAADDGFQATRQALDDPDLASVRSLPEFAALRPRL